MDSPQALSRFHVIDLTRVRAGPTCVRQLADWGAQVIKIETLDDESMGGPRLGSDFQNLHRNKRSMTLNLKQQAGRDILFKLVERADVLVENYRPDVKDRLGIDYESLRAINPRLVYGSISGFGQDGPYRARPGFDQIAQGMGGVMSVTGAPGQGPMRAGIPIADLGAGLFCALGILTALLEREVSGQGQWVQSSLLSAQVALLDFQATRWLMDKQVPPQAGNDHPTAIPTGVFPSSDGYINIAASGEQMWLRFCELLGTKQWLTDARFATPAARSKNRIALNAEIAQHTAKRSTQEWVDLCNDAGVPAGPINTIDKVFADPQVRHLGMAQKVAHPQLGDIELVGQAVKLSRTPSRIKTATPAKGQHTDEVLEELGYDEASIGQLKAAKIV